MPPGSPPRRRRESLRDRLFSMGVVLAFTAVAVGVSVLAPVVAYDCAGDAAGGVACTVHRRAFGFIPLSDRTISPLASVDWESAGTVVWTSGGRRRSESSTRLVLVGADGTRWTSVASSWPLGPSNDTLASQIRLLFTSDGRQELHARQADGVVLLVSAAFLVPAALMLLGLLLRMVVPAATVEERLAALDRATRARRA
jgi:hypothetical protein